MKRLLYYLNQITDTATTTYRYTVIEDGRSVQREIYDGECGVVHLKPNGERDSEHIGVRREPIFWQEGISYTFDRTNKMALDRPTVTIAIPTDKLGIDRFSTAAADFCLRTIKPYFDEINEEYANKSRPDSDNGKFIIYAPSSEILVRNSAYFAMRPAKDYTNGRGAVIYHCKYIDPPPDMMCLCVRIEIQLSNGKLKRAIKMLTKDLPFATERFVNSFDNTGFRSALELEDNQNKIRDFLRNNAYCAFIANGSILPREKGTNLPMKNALPFQSVPEDEIEISGIKGMGIKRGVTVITGGGYSGKSTILNAVSAGIYNHFAGDGRELCITDESAVTITAEDGRSVSSLNISPFIKWIPGGNTYDFSTAHASGSTSQAANIIEAIECGAKLLLIDEDRSATNFMIRDALMKKLINKEPITPFTDRVRELVKNKISTILVIGGSGEYISVADKVYMMDEFIIHDATAQAKNLTFSTAAPLPAADWKTRRVMHNGNFLSYPEGSGSEKLGVSDTGFIIIGDERIDVRALHDIATAAQIDTLAFMLRFLQRTDNEKNELEMLMLNMRGLKSKTYGQEIDIMAKIQRLYEKIKGVGLDIVDTGFFTEMNRFLELPREYELRAVINRMRRITWTAKNL